MRYIILDTRNDRPRSRRAIASSRSPRSRLIDRRPDRPGRSLLRQPDREIDAGATDVHGLIVGDAARQSREFGEIARRIHHHSHAGAQWIIHNAPFDLAFLDEELTRLGLSSSAASLPPRVVDTLALARATSFREAEQPRRAVRERFRVANAHRTLHGALLDAQLLAGGLPGDDTRPGVADDRAGGSGARAGGADAGCRALPPIRVLEPFAEELAARIGPISSSIERPRERCLWLALGRSLLTPRAA